MKTIKIFMLALLILSANACKDFDELQIDPNRVTQAHPGLILTNLEAVTFNVVDLGSALSSRVMIFTDGATDEQYYAWQRSSFDRYNRLRDVMKMNEEAERLGLENYQALALFFQSYHILEITKVFGDVPYTEALQAADGAYFPKYDEQQEIYQKVLTDLTNANAMLDASKGAISGDIIYGGDITKWKKLINSFHLRVLMSLSLKTGNTSLNVATRFAQIVGDPTTYPIFTSNADNGQLVWVDITGNRNPFLNSNNLKTAYYMEESFINLLKSNNDPRLFTFADQTPDAKDANLPIDDFSSYDGADGSAPLSEITQRVSNGEISRINPRYYTSPTNEPSVLMGYAELQFILAEGAARGWISGTPAATYYENGIRASFSFHGIGLLEQDQYMTEPGVVYATGTGISQIVTQKYINFFMGAGWETFYNQARTGFPEFSVDGGGVVNNQQIPKRWMYPQDEATLNPDNLQAAITRQYPGGDNVNGVPWILKAE